MLSTFWTLVGVAPVDIMARRQVHARSQKFCDMRVCRQESRGVYCQMSMVASIRVRWSDTSCSALSPFPSAIAPMIDENSS